MESKDNEKECELSAQLVSIHARRFPAGRWSFLGLGSEKKWYSTHEYKPQGEWDRVAEQMMIKFSEKADTQFSEPRVHCPEERSKAKEVENYRYTSVPMGIETVFRTIISVNQLSIYGAVSDLCEEYSTCQTRTGRPVLAGQSDPLFAPAKLLIVTLRLSIETLAQENFLQQVQRTSGKSSSTRSSDKDLY